LGIAGEDAVGVGVDAGVGEGAGVGVTEPVDVEDALPPPPQLDRTISSGNAQPRTADALVFRI